VNQDDVPGAAAVAIQNVDIRNTNKTMIIITIRMVSLYSIILLDNKTKESDNYDYSNKDPSNNLSYEEKGTQKISLDIIVPDYLVSLLIGKNGECIRGIMNKSGSMINFQKEVMI
jgi:hypothetical protein